MFWKRQNFRARNQISGFWEWRWGEGTDSERTGGNLGSDGAVLGLDCGVITRLCQNSSNCVPKKGEFLNANSNNLNANYTPVSLPYTYAHTQEDSDQLARIRATGVSRKWPLGCRLCYTL